MSKVCCNRERWLCGMTDRVPQAQTRRGAEGAAADWLAGNNINMAVPKDKRIPVSQGISWYLINIVLDQHRMQPLK